MRKRKPLDLNQLSDKDIIRSFYLSQGLLFIIGCLLYIVFHHQMIPISEWISIQPFSMILLGVVSGVVLALFELVLDRLVPETWFDDGGINTRIFQAFSRLHILYAMLVVAVVEEGLFRGVLQTQFGLVVASLLFGLVHIRYLKKPLMLIVALGMGFYLGWLYLLSDNLLVPIVMHYFIDVILGLVLKHRTKEREPYC